MRADKSSIVRFFVAYFGSLAFLFVVIGGLYYSSETAKEEARDEKEMAEFAKKIEKELGDRHFAKTASKPIGRDGYGVALYDIDGELVAKKAFGEKPPLKNNFYKLKNRNVYVHALGRYFLGVAFIAVESKRGGYDETLLKTIAVGIGALIFMGFVAIYLAKLAALPMAEAMRSLDDFVKDAAHELSTPIMSVSTALDVLRQKGDPSIEVALKRAEIGVRNLQIVYGELAMSCFYERLQEEPQIVDMKTLVAERLEYFAPMFEYKNITVSKELKNAPLKIERAKAERVIDNILSNAVKYTKKGGFVEVYSKEGLFGVKDDGYGIDETKLTAIFDRYARASTQAGGFGIGLSTVKKICDEYGVKIEVKSKKNEGSEFVFRW